jgi:hypothetical protein
VLRDVQREVEAPDGEQGEGREGTIDVVGELREKGRGEVEFLAPRLVRLGLGKKTAERKDSKKQAGERNALDTYPPRGLMSVDATIPWNRRAASTLGPDAFFPPVPGNQYLFRGSRRCRESSENPW